MTASESVKIIVHPSGAAADTLTVSDAMQQVLDAFELLTIAEEQPDRKCEVMWKLERASTNSPLTIEAVAIGKDPADDVGQEARQAKVRLADGLSQILQAKSKPVWVNKHAEETIRRLLSRTLDGVGRTDLHLIEEDPPIVIDHPTASRAIGFLDIIAAEAAAKVEDLTRTEFGSVDGNVAGTITHYGKPAILIKARLSGKIVKCVFSPTAAHNVGPIRNWEESWSGQRVLVRGRLEYDKTGNLVFIHAEHLEPIKDKEVRLSDLRDPNQSGQINVEEYLKTIWGETDG